MTEDPKNPKLKKVILNEGKVDVDLDREFATNNEFHVETAAAICGAISCKFSVDVRLEKDMRVSVFGCKDGKVRVFGTHFSIDELDKDDWTTVSSDINMEYVRVKNVKGTFQITVKDSAGQPQPLDLKTGEIAKIWTRPTSIGNNVSISIMIITPDDKVREAFTYTETEKRSPEDMQKLMIKIKDDEARIKETGEKWDRDVEFVTTTTTTTTTFTTTTTIASPTPVGRR
jgi:hypothetical protein